MVASTSFNGHSAERNERARIPSESTAGGSGDLEKNLPEHPERRNDPFRDGQEGEETGVRYRTMHWWLVLWNKYLSNAC